MICFEPLLKAAHCLVVASSPRISSERASGLFTFFAPGFLIRSPTVNISKHGDGLTLAFPLLRRERERDRALLIGRFGAIITASLRPSTTLSVCLRVARAKLRKRSRTPLVEARFWAEGFADCPKQVEPTFEIVRPNSNSQPPWCAGTVFLEPKRRESRAVCGRAKTWCEHQLETARP